MKNQRKLVYYLPTIGIFVFTLLYFYSSSLYPGGSAANSNSEGFDWVNNYWCNLMNEQAINGQTNPARIYAITASMILCLSLNLFFFLFAEAFSSNLFWKRTIQIFGTISMFLGIFMFTKWHDELTILASVFGFFAVLGVLVGIAQMNKISFKLTGVFCIFLLGLNNYIYYTGHGLERLALIQKLSFMIVLIWIIALNIEIVKSLNKNKGIRY